MRNYKSVAGPPNIFINPPVAQLRELSISDTNMANQKSKASKAPTTFASSRETNTDHLHDETLSHNRMAKRKFKTAPSDDDSDSEPIIRIPQRKRLCQKSPASAATHDNITSLDGANDISDSAVAVSTRESKKKQGRSLIITLPAEVRFSLRHASSLFISRMSNDHLSYFK